MRRFAILAALAMATPATAMSLLEATRPKPAQETCKAMGTVCRLDPNGDNNLSVRVSPSGRAGLAYEKDELFSGEHVCVTHMSGPWAFVIYQRGGRAFSGWVHANYIHLDEAE
jgi:hypothetical protein